jgi:hypothetical protein
MKRAKNDRDSAGILKIKTRQQIKEKLEKAFASLLPMLGEKRFNKRIKKAGKVLSHNLNGSVHNEPVKSLAVKIHSKKPRPATEKNI